MRHEVEIHQKGLAGKAVKEIDDVAADAEPKTAVEHLVITQWLGAIDPDSIGVAADRFEWLQRQSALLKNIDGVAHNMDFLHSHRHRRFGEIPGFGRVTADDGVRADQEDSTADFFVVVGKFHGLRAWFTLP
ncbi:MAG: hypothetical protein ACPG4K_03770 [Haloferula sp.]